jgi:hypothetical protein
MFFNSYAMQHIAIINYRRALHFAQAFCAMLNYSFNITRRESATTSALSNAYATSR